MFGCAISINISPLTGLESLKLIRMGNLSNSKHSWDSSIGVRRKNLYMSALLRGI
jgi:hypothetical protein